MVVKTVSNDHDVLAVLLTTMSCRFAVIDGQQRLVTITVMLCALRDRARELGFREFANSIETNSILFQDANGAPQAKIVPRFRDRETLLRIIGPGKGIPDADALLTKAYKYFAQQFKSIGEVQAGLWEPKADEILKNVYHTIIQRLRLVMIALDDYDNPSNVYESLNFKGEKLSDADLIRNLVFMQLPLDKQETFDNNVWKPFESHFDKDGHLDTSEVSDFYYRFMISKTEYFPRNRLYVRFMEHINKFKTEVDLEGLVNELKRFAKFYLRITRTNAVEPELKHALERFRMLEIDTAVPLVLAMYDRFESEDEEKRITLSEFLSMLQALESFVIRRSMLKMRTRGYGLDFAQAISHSANFADFAKFLAKKKWPTDTEIEIAIKEFPLYHHESKKTLLILVEIERAFGHKEQVDPNNLTIEHVLPQTLNLAWRKTLGPKADEIHAKYVHTLGNLTLTGYNGTLGDKPFETKKAILAESNIQMNAYFAQCKVWNEAEIIKRTGILTKEFIRIWGRPEGEENVGDADAESNPQQRLMWDF